MRTSPFAKDYPCRDPGKSEIIAEAGRAEGEALLVVLLKSQRCKLPGGRTHAAAGVPTKRKARGVAAQIALACRESPVREKVYRGSARTLDPEVSPALRSY